VHRSNDGPEDHEAGNVRVVTDVHAAGVRPFVARECVGRIPAKRAVFAALIEWELRHSDLNRSARRRLVQYAAQLGFSGEQAGQFIRTPDPGSAPVPVQLKWHPVRSQWGGSLRGILGPACIVTGALCLALSVVVLLTR
jgi:hypothetical protein